MFTVLSLSSKGKVLFPYFVFNKENQKYFITFCIFQDCPPHPKSPFVVPPQPEIMLFPLWFAGFSPKDQGLHGRNMLWFSLLCSLQVLTLSLGRPWASSDLPPSFPDPTCWVGTLRVPNMCCSPQAQALPTMSSAGCRLNLCSGTLINSGCKQSAV